MKRLLFFLLPCLILMLAPSVSFSESVVEAWITRYNGPGNKYDAANAIAVTDAGNSYVTGWSNGDGSGEDYCTIKYNADGEEQWVARYNGPDNNSDTASDITLDIMENVYVTGYSNVRYDDSDYATIKYNSDGIEQWVARYNSSWHGYDLANSIAVDQSGNVYVTGRSYVRFAGWDYATIKYSSDGVEQWVARYDGPDNDYDAAVAIAVDQVGNVYVTGWSRSASTNYDYLTIKYNIDGVEQWVARYNGPGNGADKPIAIVVDEAANIFVTGVSDGIGTAGDYATIKYNSDGVEQWVVRYTGPGAGYDRANSLAVDQSGNVYVTGRVYVLNNTWDYATIKYDDTGDTQWVTLYNGPLTESEDYAEDIAVDESGNVYVTGHSQGYHTGNDYATIKYDDNGDTQWVQRYDGPGSDWDVANSIGLDQAGNVYITGQSMGIGTGTDYATIKYSSVVETEPPQNIELNAWDLFPVIPNPNFGAFTISYYIPEASEVTVGIYDLSGRLESIVSRGNQDSGLHQLQLFGIPTGVYFCRLESGSVSFTEKFVVIR